MAVSITCTLQLGVQSASFRTSTWGACAQVGRYANTGDALAKIVRTEGVHALFRGIGPSVLAIIPEAAITYGVLLTRAAHSVPNEKLPAVLLYF